MSGVELADEPGCPGALDFSSKWRITPDDTLEIELREQDRAAAGCHRRSMSPRWMSRWSPTAHPVTASFP
jgi:hypothetical protein